MQSRPLIWIGMTLGSLVGGYIPVIWGDSAFSMTALLLSGIGGCVGIWAGFKMSQ